MEKLASKVCDQMHTRGHFEAVYEIYVGAILIYLRHLTTRVHPFAWIQFFVYVSLSLVPPTCLVVESGHTKDPQNMMQVVPVKLNIVALFILLSVISMRNETT